MIRLRRAQPLCNGASRRLALAVNADTRSFTSNTPDQHASRKAFPAPTTPAIHTPSERAVRTSERAVRTRHLLRALLRECSYLPDPAAKQYLTRHVLSRFRTSGQRAWERRKDPEINVRLRMNEREARHALNLLKRANDGAPKPLKRVLFKTYGRIGPRRYELMKPLMPKKAAAEEVEIAPAEAVEDREDHGLSADVDQVDPGDIECARLDEHEPEIRNVDIELVSREPTTSTHTPKALPQLTPELYALAKSQIRTSPPTRTRPNPRNLEPDIPKLNAKMRPMPKSRVKNIAQKWYANTLDRLLPPLPTQEWCQLRELAAGRGIREQLSKRRRPPKTSSSVQASALEEVLIRGTSGIQNPPITDTHELTPRFMQRVYAAVFGQCPRMDWDVQEQRWEVTWGSQTLSRAPNAGS